MMKILCPLLTIFLISTALSANATGSVNISGGTWTIRQYQGTPIKVKKVVIDELEDGSSVLIYTLPNGTEGFIESKKVSNLEDLLQMIKTGKFIQDVNNSKSYSRKFGKTTPIKQSFSSQEITKKTTSPRNNIRSNCEQKWGGDYKMVNFCVNQQTIAKRKVTSNSGGIRSRCEQKWGTDYKMVAFCIDQQTTAKKNVSSHSGGIKLRCEQKWGKDYKMVNFCIDQQTTAKRNIQSTYRSSSQRHRCERKWGTDYKMVEFCIEH